jgi:hypothetical protein
MWRPAARAVSAIALAAAIAGCAGKTTAKPTPTTTAAQTIAAPTLTSDADRATCQRLERRSVSCRSSFRSASIR